MRVTLLAGAFSPQHPDSKLPQSSSCVRTSELLCLAPAEHQTLRQAALQTRLESLSLRSPAMLCCFGFAPPPH